MINREHYDCVVIGGGFFGLYIAEFMSHRLPNVLVCEKEKDVMQRASLANQARVHSGYHYPRSILTALRARVSFPKFVEEFKDCIDDNFDKYYAVGRILSKVTAKQFSLFCNRIGAFCEPAPYSIVKLFEPQFIEAVFSVREYAFDAARMKLHMVNRLRDSGVEIQVKSLVTRVCQRDQGGMTLQVSTKDGAVSIVADRVINCTYSQINQVNKGSGLQLIPLKHEMTEMALVRVPEELNKISVTVMCGPFFSVMPFPPRQGLHTFSHVRYTPHFEWSDALMNDYVNAHQLYDAVTKRSAWPHMQRDAMRYMPILGRCEYVDSIWEIKTVLPLSEVDDSRPILLKADYMIPQYYCVMGGKIDQIYDAIQALSELMGVVHGPT